MLQHQPDNSRGDFCYNGCVYKNISYYPHFHKNYELIYIFRGELCVTENGVELCLSKGELLLINPNCVHSFSPKTDTLFWVGVFSKDFISLFAKKNESELFSKFVCDPETDAFLQNRLFINGTPEPYTAIACLNLVCSECVKRADKITVVKNVSVMNSILNYVSENFTQNIKLSEMASRLGYEYHYFSGLFNDCFGMSFCSFVNQYRYERACELLRCKDADITAVAFESGFQSVRSFNRVFMSLCGVKPSEYKEHM